MHCSKLVNKKPVGSVKWRVDSGGKITQFDKNQLKVKSWKWRQKGALRFYQKWAVLPSLPSLHFPLSFPHFQLASKDLLQALPKQVQSTQQPSQSVRLQ